MSPRRHGHALGGKPSPTYHAWAHMIKRCRRPTDADYPNYRERGLTGDGKRLIVATRKYDVTEDFLALRKRRVRVGARPPTETP